MERSQLMVDLVTGGDPRLDQVHDFLDQEEHAELEQLLSADDDYLRGAAAWALGQLGDPRSLQPLCAALGDPDTGVVEMVVWAVTAFDDLAATEPLLLLSTSRRGHLRAQAATSLGGLRASAAWPRLLDMLEDPSVEAKSAAVGAIGDLIAHDPIERERALKRLRPLLDDVDASVVVSVVEVLCEQHDLQSLPALIGLLNHDQDWIRGVTARALGVLGDARALKPVERLTEDTDPRIRRIAYEAVAQLS